MEKHAIILNCDDKIYFLWQLEVFLYTLLNNPKRTGGFFNPEDVFIFVNLNKTKKRSNYLNEIIDMYPKVSFIDCPNYDETIFYLLENEKLSQYSYPVMNMPLSLLKFYELGYYKKYENIMLFAPDMFFFKEIPDDILPNETGLVYSWDVKLDNNNINVNIDLLLKSLGINTNNFCNGTVLMNIKLKDFSSSLLNDFIYFGYILYLLSKSKNGFYGIAEMYAYSCAFLKNNIVAKIFQIPELLINNQQKEILKVGSLVHYAWEFPYFKNESIYWSKNNDITREKFNKRFFQYILPFDPQINLENFLKNTSTEHEKYLINTLIKIKNFKFKRSVI